VLTDLADVIAATTTRNLARNGALWGQPQSEGQGGAKGRNRGAAAAQAARKASGSAAAAVTPPPPHRSDRGGRGHGGDEEDDADGANLSGGCGVGVGGCSGGAKRGSATALALRWGHEADELVVATTKGSEPFDIVSIIPRGCYV